jgi:hypothetical protein
MNDDKWKITIDGIAGVEQQSYYYNNNYNNARHSRPPETRHRHSFAPIFPH